jgi:hypothetical protein
MSWELQKPLGPTALILSAFIFGAWENGRV